MQSLGSAKQSSSNQFLLSARKQEASLTDMYANVDRREQLGEAYFRRAQAKLLLQQRHERSDEQEGRKDAGVDTAELVHEAFRDANQVMNRYVCCSLLRRWR